MLEMSAVDYFVFVSFFQYCIHVDMLPVLWSLVSLTWFGRIS